MRVLLDTHVFLWRITNDPRLPTSILDTLLDESNDLFLSVASIWEAVIKHQQGKLPFPAPPAVLLPDLRDRQGIASLPVDEGAMLPLASLPLLHRDPFDRLILAQTLQHSMTLATVDTDVIAYPVPTIPLK